jgi:MFS family permease
VFLLFPSRLHPIATTIAGVMAVLAPTVGPVVGGWITETWSWHWLFLINVAPGVIAAIGRRSCCRATNLDFRRSGDARRPVAGADGASRWRAWRSP